MWTMERNWELRASSRERCIFVRYDSDGLCCAVLLPCSRDLVIVCGLRFYLQYMYACGLAFVMDPGFWATLQELIHPIQSYCLLASGVNS